MSWTAAAARQQLRFLLSDGDTDKLAHRKAVFGLQDDGNLLFKTLEFRRVSTLVGKADPDPQGVFVNNARVSVGLDDVASGQFQLDAPPSNGDEVRATYYYQWFTDAELDFFIVDASRFVQSTEDCTTIPMGLRQAALQYAAYDAYQKLASRWAQKQSDVYRVEDSLKEDSERGNPFLALAKDCRKCAMDLRDDYYQKQGQALNPAYGSIPGRIREVVPKR